MLLKRTSFNLKENKKIMLIAGVVLIVLSIAVIWLSALVSSNKIYKGVYIENLDVSGLTVYECSKALEDHLSYLYETKVYLIKFDNYEWKVKPGDIDLKYDLEEAVNSAYGLGRKGDVFKRLYSIRELGRSKTNLPVKLMINKEKLSSLFEGIKSQIDTASESSTIEYKNNKINISEDKPGRSVDIEANVRTFENGLNDNNFNSINLIVETIRPEITYDDIKDIGGVLGSTVTSFNAHDTNRTFNIKLACERINGRILMPEESFSMNEALGPRTLENGYKDAKVIYQNEFIDGPGGGVCQVTTTLYGSVLKAGVKVLERMHHSMPLGYVEPGQDATIAENYIDFKFRNSRGYPVAIAAEAIGSNLYIRLLGKKDDSDYTVKLRSVVIEEYIPEGEEVVVDNTIPDNEKRVAREAVKGIKVNVYREVYNKSGQLLDKQKVSEDLYKPVKTLIKVNQNYFEVLYGSKSSI